MEYFGGIDSEALFQEIVEKGRAEGIAEQEAYNDLVDDVIETHRDWQEIHDDSPTDGLGDQLRGRFADYKAALGLGEEQPEL